MNAISQRSIRRQTALSTFTPTPGRLMPAELNARVLRIESANVRTQTECVKAVTAVMTALAEQREAVRLFKEKMAEAKRANADLLASVRKYQRSLRRIETKTLRRNSLRLAEIADEWASAAQKAPDIRLKYENGGRSLRFA